MRGEQGGSYDISRLLLGLSLHYLVETHGSGSSLPQVLQHLLYILSIIGGNQRDLSRSLGVVHSLL